jgi:Zn-finger nucleic acid-binding protein
MSLALANRKDAIRKHIDREFPWTLGYGSFRVELSRTRKHQPRVIKVSWSSYPFEEQVAESLGDLMAEDVTFERTRMWSCGTFHPDSMEAWKAHEGNHLLEYPADDYGNCCYMAEEELPEHVEMELREQGETFESSCVPGNYMRCPTCDGGSRYMPHANDRPRRIENLRYAPCPDCATLGIDRQEFPGILNLDVPAQREFYEAKFGERRSEEARTAAREEAKRQRALAQPAATAKAKWSPLPSRAAGVLNGIPVPTVAPGCDYLAHADDEARRSRCGNNAQWFDPTTGLRVCTRHRNGDKD